MTVLSTNVAYDSFDAQTAPQWVAKVFAGGDTCLLEQESLSLEEEIGEGAFGKVFRGLCIIFCNYCRANNNNNNNNNNERRNGSSLRRR